MKTIKEQLFSDISLFFNTDVFAEEVTIYNSSGTSLASDVPCNFIDSRRFETFNSVNLKDSAEAHIPISYHPNGKFKIGDKIKDEAGIFWKVEAIIRVEYGVAHLEIRQEGARSNFRV